MMTVEERFWDKVLIGENCWEWQATLQQTGYGLFRLGGRMRAAHRVAYELHYGVNPGDLFVCHRCDNRK